MEIILDVRCLSKRFYEAYNIEQFPELLKKTTRPYACLFIQLSDYTIGIPYRTNINPHNHSAFFFRSSARSKKNRSGLDYTKMVIIKDERYITSLSHSIDQDEYLETIANSKRIASEAIKYISGYITAVAEGRTNNWNFSRAYRYTTLQYFHKELGMQ